MCKSEPVCHRGYLVGLLFREISMKREEQNNRRAYAALIGSLLKWSLDAKETLLPHGTRKSFAVKECDGVQCNANSVFHISPATNSNMFILALITS